MPTSPTYAKFQVGASRRDKLAQSDWGLKKEKVPQAKHVSILKHVKYILVKTSNGTLYAPVYNGV